jgi:8-oxo-dGTP pyrophosphatase MutT (NUDIX family)
LEIMLVTSRGTQRWIIPKGWPKRGMPPYDTAAKEAFEEAGVIGKVRKRPIVHTDTTKFWKRVTRRAVAFRYLRCV